ncbi:MAG TPA: hypothetical protein VH143_25875 [Kofleriaceae bacterium]|nr:hypothetical protein [Kofleriaceae bacterium]
MKWIFGKRVDLAVFGGTALVAIAVALALPYRDATRWSWITGVLLVDVAHVWSTAFVVYLDPAELRRRPLLYGLVPVLAFAAGVALYARGPLAFWRAIAYLAVFHFVRQQYGWVMMYRAKNGERDRFGRWLDGATVYLATLYPLAWWHAHLPRHFSWMIDGDFVPGVPSWLASVLGVAYACALVAYVARAVMQRSTNWGKHLVVATTAACWYVGIVATDSDYAFTITNVFVHGVPYMALVYVYARNAARERESHRGLAARLLDRRRGVLVFLASLWAIAYVEELLWDHTLWHDRPWLFGGGFDLGKLALVIAPLLAVPQLTHYVLDGWLWRRATNPRLGRLMR